MQEAQDTPYSSAPPLPAQTTTTIFGNKVMVEHEYPSSKR
jgi:hypothetical protein